MRVEREEEREEVRQGGAGERLGGSTFNVDSTAKRNARVTHVTV
jgi:hypothetical protein